jgi:hypothetical protein
MTLEFSSAGKFIINMESYIDEIMRDLPKNTNRTATTPSADHLLKTLDYAVRLDKTEVELFHHVIAQMFSCENGGNQISTQQYHSHAPIAKAKTKTAIKNNAE